MKKCELMRKTITWIVSTVHKQQAVMEKDGRFEAQSNTRRAAGQHRANQELTLEFSVPK